MVKVNYMLPSTGRGPFDATLKFRENKTLIKTLEMLKFKHIGMIFYQASSEGGSSLHLSETACMLAILSPFLPPSTLSLSFSPFLKAFTW